MRRLETPRKGGHQLRAVLACGPGSPALLGEHEHARVPRVGILRRQTFDFEQNGGVSLFQAYHLALK